MPPSTSRISCGLSTNRSRQLMSNHSNSRMIDRPTATEQLSVVEARLQDLRLQHYTLELDKVAARAAGADDSEIVVMRLELLQRQVENAYKALMMVKHDLDTLSLQAESCRSPVGDCRPEEPGVPHRDCSEPAQHRRLGVGHRAGVRRQHQRELPSTHRQSQGHDNTHSKPRHCLLDIC